MVIVRDDRRVVNDRHVLPVRHAIIIDTWRRDISSRCKTPEINWRSIATDIEIDADADSRTDRGPAIIIATVSPGYPGG